MPARCQREAPIFDAYHMRAPPDARPREHGQQARRRHARRRFRDASLLSKAEISPFSLFSYAIIIAAHAATLGDD